jgi:hypothetical protein
MTTGILFQLRCADELIRLTESTSNSLVAVAEGNYSQLIASLSVHW